MWPDTGSYINWTSKLPVARHANGQMGLSQGIRETTTVRLIGLDGLINQYFHFSISCSGSLGSISRMYDCQLGNYYLSNRKQNCCQKSNFRIAHDPLGTELSCGECRDLVITDGGTLPP
jgi:hypothetical protein